MKFVVVEHILAVVSPLQGMVIDIGYDQTRISWHVRYMPKDPMLSQ